MLSKLKREHERAARIDVFAAAALTGMVASGADFKSSEQVARFAKTYAVALEHELRGRNA